MLAALDASEAASMALFTLSELKRRRARLEERLAWLQKHLDENPRGWPRSAAEASALQTALVLFDEEIERVQRERPPAPTPPGWRAEIRSMGFTIVWHDDRDDFVRGDVCASWRRATGVTSLQLRDMPSSDGPNCADGPAVAAWLRLLGDAA